MKAGEDRLILFYNIIIEGVWLNRKVLIKKQRIEKKINKKIKIKIRIKRKNKNKK